MAPIKRLIAWGLLSLLYATAVFAQGNLTGTISGRISDQDGAALPGVTVTVSSPALQGTRSVTTTATGDYVIPFLPPGAYSVTIELKGFETLKQSATVTVAGTATVDSRLR